jgi:phosphoribosylglycinamide formyltransferase-1
MTHRKALRVMVLASGSGTGFENLVVRSRDGRLSGVEIVALGVSTRKAGAIVRAERLGIPAELLDPMGGCRDPQQTSEAMECWLNSRGHIDLCVMAGFLKRWIIPPGWRGRVMNIHPSLLPSFGGPGMYGHNVHEAVVASGVKVTGCTVHFADDEYDRGPIILQRAIPVFSADTAEDVAKRVLQVEYEAYPAAVQMFAEGRLSIEGRRVLIAPKKDDAV